MVSISPLNTTVCRTLSTRDTRVPNKGEQMARHYGYYSNVLRGKRKKTGADDKIPDRESAIGYANPALRFSLSNPGLLCIYISGDV